MMVPLSLSFPHNLLFIVFLVETLRMTNEHHTLILLSIKSLSDCLFSVCAKYSDSSRRRYIATEIEKFGKGNISAQAFTFRELCVATQNFDCECFLGSGGFGKVYKGHIKSKNMVLSPYFFGSKID